MTQPDPLQPARKIDLEEVSRLIDALELDLARARTDSTRVEALRAEVEQLRRALGPSEPAEDDVHQSLSGLSDRMHSFGDELLSDAFEGTQYIQRIGRILGL